MTHSQKAENGLRTTDEVISKLSFPQRATLFSTFWVTSIIGSMEIVWTSWESSASEWKHEAGEKMIQDDSRRRPFVRSMDFYGEEDADADGPRTRGSREWPARARRRPRRSASVVWRQYVSAPVPFDGDDDAKHASGKKKHLCRRKSGRILFHISNNNFLSFYLINISGCVTDCTLFCIRNM